MRKGSDGGKKTGKMGGKKRKKTDENSGHYVVTSSLLPERRPLERRTLVPKSVVENEDHDGEDKGGQGQVEADFSFSHGYLRLGLMRLFAWIATFSFLIAKLCSIDS